MAKPIRARAEGNNIILELPIDTLVFACENNPSAKYKVRDKAQFAEYLAENIIEFGEDESGESDLYRLLDRLFEMAAEDDIIDCPD